ncbi:MAG: hypothetical protein HY892_13085 [Deltaproteobacteria bacterium]|nr:hypothetical protein [Deltaproteobacteria bacterium]
MMSIHDTLKIILDITNALPVKIDLALTGGYAVIFHGVERTTLDLDFCVYFDVKTVSDTTSFFSLLKKNLPGRYEVQLREGSKIPDDSFKHDLIRITDTRKEILRIDLLIVRYKWELEGLQQGETKKDVPIPVLSKPYLVAMKLQASGYKDAHDIVGLMGLMTEDEKIKTFELAKRTGREKKLIRLLTPPPEEAFHEMPGEYL